MGIDNDLFAIHMDSDFVKELLATASPSSEVDFEPDVWRRIYQRTVGSYEREALQRSGTARRLQAMLRAHPQLDGLTLDMGRGLWTYKAVLSLVIDEDLVEDLFLGLPLGSTFQANATLIEPHVVKGAAEELSQPDLAELVPLAVAELLKTNKSFFSNFASFSPEELKQIHLGAFVSYRDFVSQVAACGAGYLYMPW